MEKFGIKVKGIVTYQDKYLVVKHWYDDRIEDPYQWEFVDAKIDFGENPDNAVVRIVRDGIGLNIVTDRILYTWSYMVGEAWRVGIAYLCIAMDQDIVLSEDYGGYQWITKDEFTTYIHNKALLEDILRANL